MTPIARSMHGVPRTLRRRTGSGFPAPTRAAASVFLTQAATSASRRSRAVSAALLLHPPDGLGGRGAEPGPKRGSGRAVGLRLHDPQARTRQRLAHLLGLVQPLVRQAERGGHMVQARAVRRTEQPLER